MFFLALFQISYFHKQYKIKLMLGPGILLSQQQQIKLMLCPGTINNLCFVLSFIITLKYFKCDTSTFIYTNKFNQQQSLLFFNLVPSSEETSFLTTFYGLYFSHHYTHITHYKSCWTFCVGSYSCTALQTFLLLRYRSC